MRSVPFRCFVLLLAAATLACGDGFFPRQELRERQLDYLRFATSEPIQTGSILNCLNHLERARRDRHDRASQERYALADGTIPADAWDGVFDKLYRLRDTSDFDLLYLMNMLYGFDGDPAASPELWEKARQAVLDFKYWYTDPTPDRVVDGEPVVDAMWYWSENHVLLFRVNEYLAGQRFKDRTFTVTGMNGAWHQARAREAILDWLDERARYGFTEWHSDVYYQKDITPLLTLVELAEDEEVAKRAAMVLDLVFLDVALHLHRGNFGATHGRSYIKDKATALRQDNFHSSKMLFDDTALPYQSASAADATLLARARKYRLPEVIRRIARYDEPMVDRQRMNLYVAEEPDPDPTVAPPPAPEGLDFSDEANLPFWWSAGTQSVWSMVPLTLEVGERENLWDSQFADFKLLRDLVWVEGDLEQTVANARPFLVLLWRAIDAAVLNEVNTYTYRTRDYMLSTAQDYRKGLRGAQTHIVQATLGESTVVFPQHPTYRPVELGGTPPPDWNWQREDEPGPGYWTGNGAEPRAGQHENVAIVLYAPQYAPIAQLGLVYRDETHAYFPVAHFDEVVKERNWIFGRKDEAYVALYSRNVFGWRLGQPEVFENGDEPFDLVAPYFAQNVFILEMGSLSESGPFEEFVAACEAASVVTTAVPDQDGNGLPDGYDVSYESPSQGLMTFGWHAPLVVRGQEQTLSDYPRFDNPFVRADFGDTRFEISDGQYGLVLDFAVDERHASAPRPHHRPGVPPTPPGPPGECPPGWGVAWSHGDRGHPGCPRPWGQPGPVHSGYPRWPDPSPPSP